MSYPRNLEIFEASPNDVAVLDIHERRVAVQLERQEAHWILTHWVLGSNSPPPWWNKIDVAIVRLIRAGRVEDLATATWLSNRQDELETIEKTVA